MRFKDKPRRKATINLTSLIDVLFLLLTFFLVSTTFIEQSALKVELPSMRHADRVRQEKRFILNVSRDGQMFYNGEVVGSDDLKSLLTQSSEEVNASGGLVLRADKLLPYGDVIGILDLIKGSGVTRFVIATEEQGAR